MKHTCYYLIITVLIRFSLLNKLRLSSYYRYNFSIIFVEIQFYSSLHPPDSKFVVWMHNMQTEAVNSQLSSIMGGRGDLFKRLTIVRFKKLGRNMYSWWLCKLIRPFWRTDKENLPNIKIYKITSDLTIYLKKISGQVSKYVYRMSFILWIINNMKKLKRLKGPTA